MTNPNRRQLGASPNPLPDIGEALFVQSRISEAKTVAGVAGLEEVGVTLTLDRRKARITSKTADVRAAIDTIRTAAGPDVSILIDAEQYAGNYRRRATQPLSTGHVDMQLRDLGLPWALTDSGYVELGDRAGLENVLTHAARLTAAGRRVIAVLALDAKWLAKESGSIRDSVDRFGVPVGLALGHAGDPLSTRDSVRGLLHILASDVPVGLLRSDLSVIGALAGGASFGAIGTKSSLRHIFPPKDPEKESGFRAGLEPAIIVEACRSWVRRSRLADAVALTPDERHWLCFCEACQGRRIDTLYDDLIPAHNLHAGADLVRRALAQHNALDVWASECLSAQTINMDIEATVGAWTTPDYLGAWFKTISERARI